MSCDGFLGEILQHLKAYRPVVVLEACTILWRAQLDGTLYLPPPVILFGEHGGNRTFELRKILKPHDCERMTPFSDRAKEGRINPKGIPCLYTATDRHTASSEVKPVINSYLTLAEFVTVRMDVMTWEDIGSAFSEPVTVSDDIADYAPTQIVAELLRHNGYDGIRYRSKLVESESFELSDPPEPHADEEQDKKSGAEIGKGRNVALFDVTSAKFKTSKLYQLAADRYGAFRFRAIDWPVYRSDRIPED